MKLLFILYHRLLLSMLGILLNLYAESQGTGENVLLLIRPGTGKFITISSGDRIGFIKRPSEPFQEIIVENISEDTVYFHDGYFVGNRILALKIYQEEESFEPDLSSWVFVSPPSDAYNSEDMMSTFLMWADKNCHPDGSYDSAKWKLYYTKLMTGYDSVHKNFLKFNVTRILYLEFAAVYERKLSQTVSIEVEGGYQVRSVSPTIPFTYYNNTPIYAFSGPLLTLGSKFYCFPRTARYLYLEQQVLYKYVYFKQGWYEDYNQSASVFQDQYRSVFGISLNGGIQKSYFGLVFDMSVGIGVKYSHIRSLCYYYQEPQSSGSVYYNPEHSPVEKVDERWYPLVNLMVKLGFGF